MTNTTNLINLTTHRRARLQARAQGVTLCNSGFHKWKTDTTTRFDVKQGKLMTIQHCTRCNNEMGTEPNCF